MMKKLFMLTVLLFASVIFAGCQIGDDDEEYSIVGRWQVVREEGQSFEYNTGEGKKWTDSTMVEKGVYVNFWANGTGATEILNEEQVSFSYTRSGDDVTVKEGSAARNLRIVTLSNNTLVLSSHYCDADERRDVTQYLVRK